MNTFRIIMDTWRLSRIAFKRVDGGKWERKPSQKCERERGSGLIQTHSDTLPC